MVLGEKMVDLAASNGFGTVIVSFAGLAASATTTTAAGISGCSTTTCLFACLTDLLLFLAGTCSAFAAATTAGTDCCFNFVFFIDLELACIQSDSLLLSIFNSFNDEVNKSSLGTCCCGGGGATADVGRDAAGTTAAG